MPKNQKKSVYKKDLEIKRRSPPKCRKCQNHGISVNVKGHKRDCAYINCPCDLCKNTEEVRRFTRERIKQYRARKRLIQSNGMLYNNLYFLVQCLTDTIFDFPNNSYTICDVCLVKG